MSSDQNDMWFVYDGECPICTLGAAKFRVGAGVDSLHTVDARRDLDHPVMREVNERGYDLDQGMVIKYQGQFYHGDEAVHLMARMGADDDLLNRINRTMFQSACITRAIYPALRAARNLALWMKGVGKINNLDL